MLPTVETTDLPVRLVVDEQALSRGLLVAFTDRAGGVSEESFSSLNLSINVGDRPENVAENRRRVAAAAGFDPGHLRLCRQVHGTKILRIERQGQAQGGEADGMVTSAAGLVLGVLTADCAAIVLAGERRVGVVHAGWRG